MSKIFVSFASRVYDKGFQIVAFYEGFIKALEEQGNEVLAINTVEYLHQSTDNNTHALPSYFDKKKIVDQVKIFSPDLVIAFNHAIPKEVEEGCECPIVLWAVDSLKFFVALDYMKKNLDRYLFVGQSQNVIDDAIDWGLPRDKIYKIKFATHVQKEDLSIQQNISFIGNIFVRPAGFKKLVQTKGGPKLKALSEALYGKFYENTDDLFRQYGFPDFVGTEHEAALKALSSGQDRVTVLNSLQDLGLRLWGAPEWANVGRFLPALALCFDNERVYSLKHNQDIYNASKLCVSISHAQAIDGFPFRVMDIMASNGCLVSNYSSGLDELSKGYVDLPMYDNPYDARALCQKLLKDEAWRKDIVVGAQKCVENHCRWHHRFKELEEAIGIKLVKVEKGSKNKVTPTIYLKKVDYLKSKKSYAFLRRGVVLCARLLPRPLILKVYRFLNKNFGLSVDQDLVKGGLEASKGQSGVIDRFVSFIICKINFFIRD